MCLLFRRRRALIQPPPTVIFRRNFLIINDFMLEYWSLRAKNFENYSAWQELLIQKWEWEAKNEDEVDKFN